MHKVNETGKRGFHGNMICTTNICTNNQGHIHVFTNQ
jgi:hypothetical protein